MCRWVLVWLFPQRDPLVNRQALFFLVAQTGWRFRWLRLSALPSWVYEGSESCGPGRSSVCPAVAGVVPKCSTRLPKVSFLKPAISAAVSAPQSKSSFTRWSSSKKHTFAIRQLISIMGEVEASFISSQASSKLFRIISHL